MIKIAGEAAKLFLTVIPLRFIPAFVCRHEQKPEWSAAQ
jgi:hypothetical protein